MSSAFSTTSRVTISSFPQTSAVTISAMLPLTSTRVQSTTCIASLSNLNWHYPCGMSSVCFTDLKTANGMRCECASGYVGDASAGCTKLKVLINATRVIQGLLRFPVAWQTGLSDSTSAPYQTAVTQLVSLLEDLMRSLVGYMHSFVSFKKFLFAVCELSDRLSCHNNSFYQNLMQEWKRHIGLLCYFRCKLLYCNSYYVHT